MPVSPVGQWLFEPSRLHDGELWAVTGPNLKVSGFPRAQAGGLALTGPADSFTYPWYRWTDWTAFPRDAFTIDLLVRPGAKRGSMGLAGCYFVADDGPGGWSLTIEEDAIVFRVATPLGIAAVRSPDAPRGRFVALTARYDQREIGLFLDGAPAASADAALGPIALNGRTPFAVGGWWQGDRTLGFSGIVRAYALYPTALSDDVIARLAETRLPTPPPLPVPDEAEPLRFVIAPTIQQATSDAATIVWETSVASRGEVRFGELSGAARVRKSRTRRRIHKVRLSGLEAGEPVDFQVRAHRPGTDEVLAPPSRFTPLPRPGEPLRFAIIADTQDRPEVNGKLARLMRAHQPALGLVVGDLVTAGWEKDLWTDAFFASMQPLWSQVPLFPVLGNHDRNARLYYERMALPLPRYRYAFRAGDAEFFLIDTEYEVAPGSAQHRWLAGALSRSTARWKIVAHHYPPYSSDLDDYGTDLGDLSARQLAPLYDRFGVDLVLSGHIHSYERTRPMRDGRVAENGTVYVVAGGGGGDLEQFLPQPPAFSAVRRSDHHYAIVDLTPHSLTFRAYDLSNALFDSFEIRKA